jgi:hypothetical protein
MVIYNEKRNNGMTILVKCRMIGPRKILNMDYSFFPNGNYINNIGIIKIIIGNKHMILSNPCKKTFILNILSFINKVS